MRRQAMDVHQFPDERIEVVGPPQFHFYAKPVSPEEIARMRCRVGLGPDEPFLAYVCGARTARYDVEDVEALWRELRGAPIATSGSWCVPIPRGRARRTRPSRARRAPRPLAGSDGRAGGPEALDVGAIRHMASLLSSARFVASSWGTTALLEACIFDTPSLQLRWMDALPRAAPEETAMVHDFQRYIHMRAFDATGARPYCDHPSQLNTVLDDLEQRAEHYARCRAEAVARLVCLPLGGVVPRVLDAVRPIAP